ncbi:hypothetical protein RB2620 [Rhodopirellula baltica SH 1]|uniref:Uncharacterized protein n=1 Tax=Rhodopirellula baltica (strain DSM 10527 / NCIMB 13988 / SH1) TaxID=243090 RepID=Q7UVI3_RHOBA|nr:hypothetical protein RB2620 [Rhodopirellula baltica SH 1]
MCRIHRLWIPESDLHQTFNETAVCGWCQTSHLPRNYTQIGRYESPLKTQHADECQKPKFSSLKITGRWWKRWSTS